MKETSKIINPPDRYAILWDWIILAGMIVIGSAFSIDYQGSIPLPLIGTTLMGSITVIVAYCRQYILRPESITVKNQGVVLHFRFRQDRFVPWDDIEGIYSKPGPDWTKWGKGVGEGGIKVSSIKKFYLVSYPISKAVIGGYTSAKGRSPYTWDGL